MAKKQDHAISANAASKIAGVSRQAFTALKKTRSFFTRAGKVDTSHPDWLSYLKEKKAVVANADKQEGYRNAKKDPEKFNWINAPPTTIQEEKVFADIIQKKIDIEKDIDLLIEKRIVIAAFGELSKAVQLNLVDYGRRVSPRIAAKVGLPGAEKMIEKIENAEMKKSLENTLSMIAKIIKKL